MDRMRPARPARPRKRCLHAALLLLCGVLLSGLAPAQDQELPPPPPSSLAELQSRMQALMQELAIPGAGIALVQGGEVHWTGGLGVADVVSGRPVQDDTLFRIGSISKALLAMAILREVEAGRMDLQADVQALAPEMPIDNPWRDSDPVRLVHLLEHTAGFDDMHFRRMERDPAAADTLSQMRQFAPEFRVRWRPGERQSYANPGYGLAAYLLEKRTGRSATEYITSEILAPLGMHDTHWAPDDRTSARVAVGYESGKLEAVPMADISMPTAGALWSTPADMARLLSFHLSRGASVPGLLGAASIQRIETPLSSLASRAGFGGGYALANYEVDVDGWRLRGHSGGLPGYLAWFHYQPEQQFGFVLMINTIPERTRPLRQLLVQYLTRELSPPAAATRVAPDPAWEGWYRASSPRNQIMAGLEMLLNVGRIEVHEGAYRIVHPLFPEQQQFDLLPGLQTRDDGLLQANGVFTRDADGRAAWITDDTVFLRAAWWDTALPVYAILLALTVLLLGLLATPWWLWQHWRGRLARWPHAGVRYAPPMATLALLLALGSATQLSLVNLTQGRIDAAQLGVFIGGLLFGLLSLWSLWQVLRRRRTLGGGFVRGLSLASAVAACAIALWLWRVDLLALRLWAW